MTPAATTGSMRALEKNWTCSRKPTGRRPWTRASARKMKVKMMHLQGTEGYGVRLSARAKGQSVMNVLDIEDKERRLLEVATDADYAGDRDEARLRSRCSSTATSWNQQNQQPGHRKQYPSHRGNQSLLPWMQDPQMNCSSSTCGRR